MRSRDSLLNEIKSLPKGYISSKTIHGKTRFYLQHRDGLKVVGKYVKESELPLLRQQIDRRKELEKELSNLNDAPIIKRLSSNALSLTGEVMEKDVAVARFKEGELLWFDKDRAPLIFRTSHRLEPWLSSRVIDAHRTHSRLLKKMLRIAPSNDEETVLYVHAVTLVDDYWFRPQKSKLHWADVTFISDQYAALALKGDPSLLPSKARITPELTLGGSFEKCWKRIDGRWYMVKSGTKEELFSEWFCSSLANRLNIPTAQYFLENGYIYTPNFAEKENFEPMSSVAGRDDDSYEHVFPLVLGLSQRIAKEYLLLIFFDCLVNNVDRHNENCGFLRSRKTGEIISLAPNFDNNIALMAVNGYPHDIERKDDGLISCFRKFITKNKEAAKLFKSMSLPILTEDIIKKTLGNSPIKIDKDVLVTFLMNGYRRLICIYDNLQ